VNEVASARLSSGEPGPANRPRGQTELRIVLGAVAWVCAAGVALALADVPGEFGGSLCGVWGCYPPLQAVAAMHLFWCVVFLPVVWGLNRFAPGRLTPAGYAMTIAALAAAVVVRWDVSTWLDRSPAEYHAHWPKRAAQTLFTLTDVSLCQVFLAGLACLGLGRGAAGFRSEKDRKAKPQSGHRPHGDPRRSPDARCQAPTDRISPTLAPPAISHVEFTR